METINIYRPFTPRGVGGLFYFVAHLSYISTGMYTKNIPVILSLNRINRGG